MLNMIYCLFYGFLKVGLPVIALVYLYLTCSSVYLFLGISLFFKDRKNIINKIFLAISLNLAFWAFCYALMTSSSTKEAAYFFNRLSSLSWSTLFSMVLYLFIYLTKREAYLKKPWNHLPLVVPSLIAIYLYFLHTTSANEIVRASYGWTFLIPKRNGVLWDYYYGIYSVVFALVSIWLILDWGKKSKLVREKKQSKLVAYSLLASLILGSITNIILPLLKKTYLPQLAVVSILFVCLVIRYSMIKLKLMSFTSERVVLDVLKIMNEGLIITDPEGKITSINKGALQLLGYEESNLRGKLAEQFFQSDLMLSKTGISSRSENEIITQNGTLIPVLSSFSVLLDDFGDELGRVILFQNISEIKQIQNELRNAHEMMMGEYTRLHDVIDSLPGLVSVISESYVVRFANQNHNSVFGESEGKTCYEVVAQNKPCDNCSINYVFENDLPIRGEKLFYNNRIYEVTLQPFYDIDGSKLVIRNLCDITERKEAEQELSRLQTEMARLERLNLVGQMAAGIAHEIRNPMTTVRGYLQLLGSKSEYQSQESTFQLMIDELDRANIIISDFLSLARNSTKERRYQNINELLKHLFPLLEADSFSQNKQIVFVAGEIPDILISQEEISQLVLNLCRNGLEAMEEGGTVTIRTYLEDDHVVLSVKDEGKGIEAGDLDKIGTPFFTTKEKGTGLGLSTCYNIAAHHNARLEFISNPNGTTFLVRFITKK
ncbi:PAS domain S-box [Desulfosporosinus acidiphilus SJ4]|uniref:histidine kinase n=2 Tax=Desulfosporosinus TaxID=79206 RepID=I4D264_DESAJ|nr:PAS domain S-box [Desulfosporosinus acidiphilus SJ4]